MAVITLTDADEKHAAWSYSGDTGPAHWGNLDPTYASCKTGDQQSPIDISNTVEKEGEPLEFHYTTSQLSLVNNGHTIQQNLDPGSYVVANGKKFNALQFHFHHGSEHTVEGEQFAMEMHIVHAADDGELLVVGTLLELGDDPNPFLATFWDKMPAVAHSNLNDASVTLNLADFIPEDVDLYAYKGSLTTPPGTEGVNWYLFEETREISPAQEKVYRNIHPNSFRPTQPLNGRSVAEWD
tara:strand:+ start:311 stop:1027 length:717 start_codon:yes stop_codon:yes gene_type:complete